MWSTQQIKQHKKAAQLLDKIVEEAFSCIKNDIKISEFEVQRFIINRFKHYNLKTDTFTPIVSFGQNTAEVHYYDAAKSKRVKAGTLVMIDIWARLNEGGAPFADITWMAYRGGKMSAEMEKVFDIVLEARNEAINYLKINLRKKIIPTGEEVDGVARSYIAKYGYGDYFLHSTGHPLGTVKDHGQGVSISRKGKGRLSRNMGYTIEPGIYLKNKFGVRSEIDFYIDNKYNLVITSDVQKKIIKIT
jgi:Xaa-Pro dipeptidase